MASWLFCSATRLLKRSFSPLTARSISSSTVPLLLEPAQLWKIAEFPNVCMLDASWYMPNSPRNPRDEYLSKRIHRAQYLDLDEVASPHELGLKHMMPSERVFADACENFGIDRSTHVVIYDSQGVFSSPRALFMFRAFGHENSSVLNGGLPRWEAEGFPTNTDPVPTTNRTRYSTPSLDKDTIRSYEEMVANIPSDSSKRQVNEIVLDARSEGRYLGTEPEPRPGISSGHIPHTISLPFNAFLQNCNTGNLSYTTYRPTPQIHKALVDAVGTEQAELIIQGRQSVTTTCGSGMTAAILWLGLQLLGVHKVALYDESWTGYAARESSKIEKTS